MLAPDFTVAVAIDRNDRAAEQTSPVEATC